MVCFSDRLNLALLAAEGWQALVNDAVIVMVIGE
jgi:hypothetical protein